MRATAIFLALCIVSGVAAAPASPPADPRREIQDFVQRYAAAVNAGDITAYTEMFKPSPDLLVVADGRITRGWQAMRDDANSMMGKEGGYKISLGAIDVVPLGQSRALVVAPYAVTLATDKGPIQVSAAITLLLERGKSGWLIAHEHTSLQAADDGAAAP